METETTRASIEALLRAQPSVLAASLRREETADGRSHTVAYVTPSTDYLSRVESQVRRTDGDQRVSQWKMAFDLAYKAKVRDWEPTFAGWKNSYTNRPFAEHEMQEWLGATVDRVMSLKPNQVLEIGCGVGLLVRSIAPRCASYSGSDLSPIAVSRLAEYVASRQELSHVILRQGEASDLSEQPSGSVDTVVLNSVVQYFPSIDYLRRIIDEAARVVRPGGAIFIGDVRHFTLLPMFHNAVQLTMAPSDATVRWLKQRIFLAGQQERELAIDPQFFRDIPGKNPRICNVETLLKRGKTHNEMTRYRYDVVLTVGQSRLVACRPDVEWDGRHVSIDSIITHCEAKPFASAFISNVPNRRVARDAFAAQLLWSADDRRRAGSVREAMSVEAGCGIDPEDFWALADKGLCDVSISCSPESLEGSYDVTLTARHEDCVVLSPRRGPELGPVTPIRRATDPLEAAYRQRLGSELHQLLRDQLPAHDVPAAVIAVDRFPLVLRPDPTAVSA